MMDLTHMPMCKDEQEEGKLCVKSCKKRPLIVHAVQINYLFTVRSKEDSEDAKGWKVGKPGDYLMIGIEDEKYICDRDIFEKTYDFIPQYTGRPYPHTPAEF